MIILSRDRKQIINTNNIENITIINKYGEDEEKDKIKYSIIVGESYNKRIYLGTYETEDRAQEILLDIYSKVSENKSNYKMPEK